MTTRVVTLFWGTAWQRYGEIFSQSFAKFWPASVELLIVTDALLPPRRGRSLWLQDVPGVLGFINRWHDDRKARGFERPAGTKVDERGYSWKHDALKWMPQALVPRATLDGLEDGDILCWLDGDVETTAPVPEDWVSGLLGEADVALLQREGTHSEIGFIGLRVNTRTRVLLDEFAAFYTTGVVFKLGEWHSAFVFDRALERVPGISVRNLNPGGKGHVWPKSPLAACTVHHKGKRKDRR